jgi:hypothetical protein
MSTKHTPAPWSYEPPVKDTRVSQGLGIWYRSSIYVGLYEGRGNVLASVCMGGDGALQRTKEAVEANARLIAAAPELLAALQEIVDLIHPYTLGWDAKEAEGATDIALKAIQKATLG